MARSLYICYFGVSQPLVQTQVIPYLRELAKNGNSISLLTFEPEQPDGENGRNEAEKIRKELAEQGIDWNWLRYHKRFSVAATMWDILQGALFIRRSIGRQELDILHGRAHVPTLMGALARIFSRRKPKLLFDIRGFMPEEYVDGGIWPENGLIFRMAKRCERWLLKEADGFVVLTEKAREILFPEMLRDGENPTSLTEVGGTESSGRPVEVIPCCVDLERFAFPTAARRSEMRRKLGVEDRYVGVYVGSLGGWYLTTETADFFGELKAAEASAYALILTQTDPNVIEPLLKQQGLSESDYLIRKVPPSEVPQYLGAADVALSFCIPTYSKQAASPTKNAEYLACGLPFIANSGAGDVEKLIGENGVGAIVPEFSRDAYRNSIVAIRKLNGVSEHCRDVAQREFDLVTVGGTRYCRMYERLVKP